MIGRIAALALVVWALGFGIFMLSLGKPVEPTEKTDAIVVLTGAPGRIDRGLELMRAKAAKRMLVSGVGREVKPHELAIQYKEQRLFRCCVDLGWEAVNTRSNADETATWVRRHGYKTVRLVTSDWHMPRARMELASQLGGDVEVIGDPVPSSPRFMTLLREYHKFLVRWTALTLGLS
ncbi:YdcF family protein [Sphingomonas sp. AOB5]|uniref:YdcF family protein n=1 Tax=Sphingomonas sp. AOB5 TaxID=3034017 RepID=UPI0023F8E263|nr:YdcF family protein [Sphingomonas sp. AOB5]MDF7774256.1 YdcF family protein [Sphingomonas sp. AOB5]